MRSLIFMSESSKTTQVRTPERTNTSTHKFTPRSLSSGILNRNKPRPNSHSLPRRGHPRRGAIGGRGCQFGWAWSLLKDRHVFYLQVLASRPPITGVLRGPGRKVPHGVLFECSWAPGSECPTECFLSAFWRFLSPKSAKKHSKSTSWGTPSQVPNNTQKALREALSGPGP